LTKALLEASISRLRGGEDERSYPGNLPGRLRLDGERRGEHSDGSSEKGAPARHGSPLAREREDPVCPWRPPAGLGVGPSPTLPPADPATHGAKCNPSPLDRNTAICPRVSGASGQ